MQEAEIFERSSLWLSRSGAPGWNIDWRILHVRSTARSQKARGRQHAGCLATVDLLIKTPLGGILVDLYRLWNRCCMMKHHAHLSLTRMGLCRSRSRTLLMVHALGHQCTTTKMNVRGFQKMKCLTDFRSYSDDLRKAYLVKFLV